MPSKFTAVTPAARQAHAGGKAPQAEAWTAGTDRAALLHDIGKIAVDLHVEHADGTIWHLARPAAKAIPASVTERSASTGLHSAATGLLYARLLDRAASSTGSRGYPRPLGRAAVRAGRPVRGTPARSANWSCKADQASVAQELGGDPSKALAAPRTPCSASCWTACATCCAKSSLNQPALGRMADPGRLVAGEQNRLGQAARHLLSQGIDGIPSAAIRRCSTCCRIMASHNRRRKGRRSGRPPSPATPGWSHAFTFLRLAR